MSAASRTEKKEQPDQAAMRLDAWLDIACLFRTRSEAQKACKGGKIAVNGGGAKPHRIIRAGDEIAINRAFGQKQTVVVRALAERHLPRRDARLLYEDRTPLTTPEEIERRRLERIYRAAPRAEYTPDKRERRMLRRLKGRA